MQDQKIPSQLPPPLVVPGACATIRQCNHSQKQWIIVLDDDPTGCQAVHSTRLLMGWDADLLQNTLSSHSFFFILTNTRAYSEEEAYRINREIAGRLFSMAPKDSIKLISRSDSTLRGHFKAEVSALMQASGPYDGLLVLPYFREGARLTLNDTHYIAAGEQLIPVHETEFARDPSFGYSQSYLPAWIEEKTGAHWKQEDVLSISLLTIRTGGVEAVYNILMQVSGGRPVVANALCDYDVEVVVLALCRAEREGKRFLYRTAASFVKIRAGLADAPLYHPQGTFKRGLVMVGSHVKKTTAQLQPLLAEPALQKIETKVSQIFSSDRAAYFQQVLQEIKEELLQDRSVLLYTERNYALSGYADKLAAGMDISDFLSELVLQLDVAPHFMIVKGGITSHDIAAKGLRMKEALVLGQIAPGVPIWKTGAGSLFGSLYYVVFPGNVGEAGTLKQVYEKFIPSSSTDHLPIYANHA